MCPPELPERLYYDSDAVQRVIVCETQVPFVTGGAESLVRELVAQLRQRGYQTELVSLPFNGGNKEELISQAAAWRLLDLTESNGVPIDLVIASKFPTYFVRHPNKVAWLVHQHRAAYELFDTEFSDFHETEADTGIRGKLMALDREMLGECRRIYAIARNVASRLERYSGLQAETIYPPPRLSTRLRRGDATDYVLSVGRLEGNKRTDLIIEAMCEVDQSLRLVVVGEGTRRDDLHQLARQRGVENRVTFTGAVDENTLVALYADAFAVVYAPFDEDYGYVTLEAFYAAKPVVTTTDAGGPLEFIEDGVNGLVCEPTAASLALAINRLAADRQRAAELGASGVAQTRALNWDAVIDRLTHA